MIVDFGRGLLLSLFCVNIKKDQSTWWTLHRQDSPAGSSLSLEVKQNLLSNVTTFDKMTVQCAMASVSLRQELHPLFKTAYYANYEKSWEVHEGLSTSHLQAIPQTPLFHKSPSIVDDLSHIFYACCLSTIFCYT